jgi:uncharacterized cupin superfamily protein
MSGLNAFEAEYRYDEAPEGYAAGEALVGSQNLGKAAGGRDLAVRFYEAPPGQHLCPYHYEYEEEWMLVLEGSVTLRTPAGEELLERGALVCFPKGPDGAHKVTGAGESPARVMMFSSAREPAMAVYPDSDKIGVWSPNPEDVVIVRRAEGKVDYWDGET